MAKFQSLAEFLGEAEPRREQEPSEPEVRDEVFALEKLSGQEFADALVNSSIFRRYIVKGLIDRTLPASIAMRIMDYASDWGKPVDRMEHTGKDGQPIETTTVVRRVVVRAPDVEEEEKQPTKYQTH